MLNLSEKTFKKLIWIASEVMFRTWWLSIVCLFMIAVLLTCMTRLESGELNTVEGLGVFNIVMVCIVGLCILFIELEKRLRNI